MQFTVDGNATLQQQEDTIAFAENTAMLKLNSYVRSAPELPKPPAAGGTAAQPGNTHVNLATFEDVDVTDVVPPLKLVELTAGQSVATVLGQNPGKSLIFVSDVWVAGAVKKIVGIR